MMVHHPRRMPDLIEQLRQHRFALTRLRFVHSGVDRPPVMLLLEASCMAGRADSVLKRRLSWNSHLAPSVRNWLSFMT